MGLVLVGATCFVKDRSYLISGVLSGRLFRFSLTQQLIRILFDCSLNIDSPQLSLWV